jgi:hypothetical protein
MYYYYIPPTYHQQYTYVPWAVDMEERAGLRKWYRVYMKNPVYSSQLVGCRLKKLLEEQSGLRKWYKVYMKNPVYSSQLAV